jgi:hypothetical protein
MKYLYQLLIITAAFALASCSSSRYYQSNPDEYSQNQNYDQQPTITYQQFYNDLSPYGNWVNYGDYGYVWVPGVSNFRPYYSNGRWAYTDYGWTWVSDYSWGWAPFHYGRWINDYNYGWMWVPGYQWAPAWVSWRGGGNYYGWAPLGPGMDANISVGSIPYNDWTFVPGRYINSPRINNYYVNRSNNVTIINNTTIINNYNNVNVRNNNARNNPVYNPGPSVNQVEQTTGSRIRKYNVVESNKPQASQITNNSLRVFRPAVNQQATTSENPRPPKVMDINQIRNASGNTTNPTNNTNNNRQSAAPVREFPKNQTPQINRNEPPVNNNQSSITPERNSTPAKVFPGTTQPERPATINPAPTNENTVAPVNNQPVANPNRNNIPVRTFPNQRQFNRNNQQTNQVRPTPAQPEPQRKDERLSIPSQNNTRNNSQPNQPVRQFNTQRPMPSNPNNNSKINERQVERRPMETTPNPPAARENSEKQEPKQEPNSSQPVREFH